MTKVQLRVAVTLVAALLFSPAERVYAKTNGQSISSPSLTNQTANGTYTFRLVPVTSFAPFYNGQNGTPDSGIATAPRQDILRVGVFNSDGNGNIASGHAIATTDDGLTTVIIDFTFTGTYNVNPDGTGSLAITPTVTDSSCTPAQPAGVCATFEGPETYAFVLNNHSSEKLLSLIETDNVGGGAKIFLTGDANQR